MNPMSSTNIEFLVHQRIYIEKSIPSVLPDIERDVGVLSLRGPGIASEFFKGGALIRVLSNHTALRELDMKNNGIDDQGAEGIAEVILKNRSLQKIDLSGNNMTVIGRMKVLDALKVNGVIAFIQFDD